MNERIRELAEQADKWSDEEFHRLFLANETPDRQKLFKTKFAQLIIEECAQIADECVVRDLNFPGEYIKDYFGVK